MSALKFLILATLKYMEVYRPREVSHFFLLKFHVECRQNHVWGPILARVMTNFVKHVFFAKVGKVAKVEESDPLGSDPLSSDPLSSDLLSSDPLSSDPLSSDRLSSDPLSSDPLSSDPLVQLVSIS